MFRARLRDGAPNAVAGMVLGLLTAVNALAYAGLIYRGPLTPGLLVGASALLAGAAVSSVAIALLAKCPGLIAAPLGSTAVVYALIPAALGAHAGLTDPIALARQVAVVCGLTTLFAGLVYWLLGNFRLGALARFLPYPVIGGYNAGLGWLFIAGGIELATGAHPAAAIAQALTSATAMGKLLACLGGGIALVAASRRCKHWAIIPIGLVAAVLGFNVIRLALGADMGAASRAGWLLGPFAQGQIWSPPDWGALAGLPPARLVATIPLVLTTLLAGGTTAIMMLSGLELELHQTIDINAELRATGFATVGAGLFGGIVASPSLTSTTLAHGLGARGRSAGVIAGAVCALMLAGGTGMLGAIPRFAIGALLVFNGAERLVDRVWFDRRRLPPLEWGALLAVLLTVVWAGLLTGVVVGLGITLLLFVLDYRQVSVVRVSATGAAHRSSVMRPLTEDAALRAAGAAIGLLRLQGYLFFLNTAALTEALPPAGPRFVIIDFRAVAGMDSSAGMTVRRVHQIARERGYALMLTGLRPALRARFVRLHLALASPGVPEWKTEDLALQYAEATVLEAAIPPGTAPPASFAALFAATLDHPVAPERIAPYLDHGALARDAVLIRQGDRSDSMSLITAGRVAVRLDQADGPSLPLATAGPGVVMGEIGFYTGVPRTATVLAEVDTRTETLSQDSLARMERDDPALASLFHRLITHMLADKLAASTRQQAQSGL